MIGARLPVKTYCPPNRKNAKLYAGKRACLFIKHKTDGKTDFFFLPIFQRFGKFTKKQ